MMYYALIILSLTVFSSSHAMMQNVSSAPIAPIAYQAPIVGAPTYPACTGMAYQYPTLREVKHSYLGEAVRKGDFEVVQRTFDGPSGLIGWLYRLLMDDDRQHVRAVHCLLYAVKFPNELTGSIVDYLWEKIQANCNDSPGCWRGFPIEFESKGHCLILNAHKNGHSELLAKLLEAPIMRYGIRESARWAAENHDMSLVGAFVEHEVAKLLEDELSVP